MYLFLYSTSYLRNQIQIFTRRECDEFFRLKQQKQLLMYVFVRLLFMSQKAELRSWSMEWGSLKISSTTNSTFYLFSHYLGWEMWWEVFLSPMWHLSYVLAVDNTLSFPIRMNEHNIRLSDLRIILTNSYHYVEEEMEGSLPSGIHRLTNFLNLICMKVLPHRIKVNAEPSGLKPK